MPVEERYGNITKTESLFFDNFSGYDNRYIEGLTQNREWRLCCDDTFVRVHHISPIEPTKEEDYMKNIFNSLSREALPEEYSTRENVPLMLSSSVSILG